MAGKKNVAAYGRKNLNHTLGGGSGGGKRGGKNVANYKKQKVQLDDDVESSLSSLDDSETDEEDEDQEDSELETRRQAATRNVPEFAIESETESGSEYEEDKRKLFKKDFKVSNQRKRRGESQSVIVLSVTDDEDSEATDSGSEDDHDEVEDDEEDDDSDSDSNSDSDSHDPKKKQPLVSKKKKQRTPLPVPKRLDLSQLRGRPSKRPPSADVETPSVTDDEKPQLISNRSRRQSVVDVAFDDKDEFPRNQGERAVRNSNTSKNGSRDDSFNDQSLIAMLEQDDDSSPGEESLEAEEEQAIVHEMNQKQQNGDLFGESRNFSMALAGEELDEDEYLGAAVTGADEEEGGDGYDEEGARFEDDDDEDDEDDEDFYSISDVSFHDDFFEPVHANKSNTGRYHYGGSGGGQARWAVGDGEAADEDEYLWSCFFSSDEGEDGDDEVEIFYSDGQGRFYSDTETNHQPGYPTNYSGYNGYNNYNVGNSYGYGDSSEETDEDVNIPPPSHRKAGSRATEILSFSNAGSRPPVLGSWDLSSTHQPFGIIDGLTTRNINGQTPHLHKKGSANNASSYHRKRAFQSDDELSELALDEFINTDELDDGSDDEANDGVDGTTNGHDHPSTWHVRKNIPMSAFRNRGVEQPVSVFYSSLGNGVAHRRDSGHGSRNQRMSAKEAVIMPVKSVRRKMKKRLNKRMKQEDKSQQSPRLDATDLIDELVDMGALSPLFRGIY